MNEVIRELNKLSYEKKNPNALGGVAFRMLYHCLQFVEPLINNIIHYQPSEKCFPLADQIEPFLNYI